MAQITLNVTLPEALEAYVNERVAEAGYGSPGDYVRNLIREDQERRTRGNLDRLLLEGLDSELDVVTPEYLTELRREAKERVARRSGKV
jgi:antitoxin ParD1/3/4